MQHTRDVIDRRCVGRGCDRVEVDVEAPPETYNVTNGGPVQSWADIARRVFVARGRAPESVTGVSTADYGAGKAMAPRPRHSALDLAKITATGFRPRPAADQLADYLQALG